MIGWSGSARRGAKALLVALALGLFGGPAQAECLAFGRDIARVWSDTALEDRLAAHLSANARRFGEIDWACLRHAFGVLSETTSVSAARDGARGGVVYRFTVDRSRNPLALLSAPGTDGVFTALVRVTAAGRVAVLRSGGAVEWVN